MVNPMPEAIFLVGIDGLFNNTRPLNRGNIKIDSAIIMS